jgi:hypothetical protein
MDDEAHGIMASPILRAGRLNCVHRDDRNDLGRARRLGETEVWAKITPRNGERGHART